MEFGCSEEDSGLCYVESLRNGVRAQGVAVLINHLFKGTLLNSSYGIATQVQGSVTFFASAIHNSLKPQVIKAEGAGERQRAIRLAETACKYSFLILLLVVAPILAELPAELDVWLKDVPPYCGVFCGVILISALTDQLALGLTLVVEAIGRIRNYSLWKYTIKILALTAMYFGVKAGMSIAEGFVFYWVFELLSTVVTIGYICRTTGETFGSYVRNVVLKILPPTLLVGIAAYASLTFFDTSPWRILVTGGMTTVVGLGAICWGTMQAQERAYVLSMITAKLGRKK